jgi:hypothetical protein
MNLLQVYVHRFLELDLFSQKRTQVRATRLLLCNLLCLGRKWITRIICMANRDQCDWSADYKLLSRSPWRSQDLFTPVVRNSLDYFDPAEPIIIAGDETKCKRAGNKVKRSRWVRLRAALHHPTADRHRGGTRTNERTGPYVVIQSHPRHRS